LSVADFEEPGKILHIGHAKWPSNLTPVPVTGKRQIYMVAGFID
jgi:hypothetical protein